MSSELMAPQQHGQPHPASVGGHCTSPGTAVEMSVQQHQASILCNPSFCSISSATAQQHMQPQGYTPTSPHSSPTPSASAPPPHTPVTSCSSSSVAELQRLSDSMGPLPNEAPRGTPSQGDHQVPNHPHYRASSGPRHGHQQSQGYSSSRLHHSGGGLHIDPRTSPQAATSQQVSVEERLSAHSHQHLPTGPHDQAGAHSPPTEHSVPAVSDKIKSHQQHKSFKNEIAESPGAAGDYFSGRGQQLPAAAAASASSHVTASPLSAPVLEESEPATTATLIEYRSETCEVHCYYKKGEAIQLIDDHIERALELQRQQQHQAGNHAGSVSPNAEKSKGCVVPMSKRQFPASFWRSDYHQGSSGHHTSATGGSHAGVGGHSTTAAGQSSESVAAAAAGAASLSSLTHAAMHANHAALTAAAAGHPDIYGHATDPYNFLGSYAATGSNSAADSWQNYMSPYSPHSRASQDVYTSMTSRLNPQQYSSLFHLQSMRQAAQGAAAGRSAIDGYTGASHSHYMTGLESSIQSTSKELSYGSWF